MKICSRCGLPKESKDFYTQSGRQTKMSWCKTCLKNYRSETQLRHKKKAVDLLGGKCSRCGYSKCLAALEFHHVNPTDKTTHTGLKNRSWKTILKEIKKCILLCANCHREEEERLRPRGAADSATLS